MRCLSTKQLMKLKSGYSTTTLRCIPVVDESQFSKALLRIPHFKCFFRFKSSLGKFHEVSFFWLAFFGAKSTAVRYQFERHEEEQVDSFDLSMYNMHLLYAHEKNLYLSHRQLDPGRQVGEHDGIRGQVCEGI